eukprot:7275208-Pyramimonas_sp.AAC.1
MDLRGAPAAYSSGRPPPPAGTLAKCLPGALPADQTPPVVPRWAPMACPRHPSPPTSPSTVSAWHVPHQREPRVWVPGGPALGCQSPSFVPVPLLGTLRPTTPALLAL